MKPFFEVIDGRKVFRSIDEDVLAALESDVQGDVKMGNTIGMLCARVRRAETERDALHRLGAKVNEIRKSIIGCQRFNWSEHAYPLVAALDAAGFDGGTYDENRANVGTLIDRANAAEQLADKLGEACETFKARIEELEKERDVAQRGCTTLSGQLEEANKEVLRLRAKVNDLGGYT